MLKVAYLAHLMDYSSAGQMGWSSEYQTARQKAVRWAYRMVDLMVDLLVYLMVDLMASLMVGRWVVH